MPAKVKPFVKKWFSVCFKILVEKQVNGHQRVTEATGNSYKHASYKAPIFSSVNFKLLGKSTTQSL